MERLDDVICERAFQTWFSSGQPPSWARIQELYPDLDNGKKPGIAYVRQAFEVYGWAARADELNTRAIQKVETDLVTARADMFRRQAAEALEIAQKARKKIMEDGFDSTNSAINAYFKANELERTSRGAAELLMKIYAMSETELVKRATGLLRRKNEAFEDVIDSESVDITEGE